MSNQTGCGWQRTFLAVASVVACLSLSGCSPATKSKVTTDAEQSDPSNPKPPNVLSTPMPSSRSPDVIVVGAGISGLSAALEGTFLGPCIVTGRVAARSLLKELDVQPQPAAAIESRCAACHDLPKLLSQARTGFWHFDKVHRATEDRGIDCRHCHSELTPYRADDHLVNRQSLTASCVLCHVAQE